MRRTYFATITIEVSEAPPAPHAPHPDAMPTAPDLTPRALQAPPVPLPRPTPADDARATAARAEIIRRGFERLQRADGAIAAYLRADTADKRGAR